MNKLKTNLRICISSTIAEDYERRGMFPEIRPGSALFRHTCKDGYSVYDVPKKIAFAVYEDASEQRLVRRPTMKSLTGAYTRLTKTVLSATGVRDAQAWMLYVPATRAQWSSACMHTRRLFSRLGITETQQTA